MVDQLSDGRLDVGVGRGTGGGTEFAMWGGDPAEGEARFEETLEILLLGLQSEYLTFHGEYFDYQDLWMELRPRQTPHPPLWWPGSPEQAGRRGMNYITAGPFRRLAESTGRFREIWREREVRGGTAEASMEEPLYGGMVKVFVADSDAEAVERAHVAYESYRGHFAKPIREGSEAEANTSALWNEAAKRSIWASLEANREVAESGPARLDLEGAMKYELAAVGSPATVRSFVERYKAEAGSNYFVASFQWGDLTHEEASRSMDLFASEMMG